MYTHATASPQYDKTRTNENRIQAKELWFLFVQPCHYGSASPPWAQFIISDLT